MKIAVDGMGGDNAPQAIIEGVFMALEDFPKLTIDLYGDEQKMAPYLKNHERLTVIHCSEVVEAEDDPARAVRRKKILQWLVCWMQLLKERRTLVYRQGILVP